MSHLIAQPAWRRPVTQSLTTCDRLVIDCVNGPRRPERTLACARGRPTDHRRRRDLGLARARPTASATALCSRLTALASLLGRRDDRVHHLPARRRRARRRSRSTASASSATTSGTPRPNRSASSAPRPSSTAPPSPRRSRWCSAAPIGIAIGLFLSLLAPRRARRRDRAAGRADRRRPERRARPLGPARAGAVHAQRRSSRRSTPCSAGSRSSAPRRRPGRGRLHRRGRRSRSWSCRSSRRSAASSSRASRASSRRARSRSARRAGRWSAASCSRSTRPGLAATLILGLSRALGEAIAVTQVDRRRLVVDHQRQPVRQRRHAREPHRERLPEHATAARDRVALLPGRDPAGRSGCSRTSPRR